MKYKTLPLLFSLLLIITSGLQAQGLKINKSKSSTVFNGNQKDYLIGNIQDVKHHNQTVYLIDEAAPKVLILSKKGKLIQQIGRAGKGPGEYLSPVSIDIFDTGDLVLLDQNLGRVTQYFYNNESKKWEVKKSGAHNMNMSNLCVSDGNVWVHARKENNVIHRLSDDLKSKSYSIGGGYDSDDIVTREISQNGVLACKGQNIYTGFTTDNIIRVYNKNTGNLLKKIEIKEAIPIEISKISRNGGVGFARKYYPGEAYNDKGDYHDGLENIAAIDNQLLVQYKRFFSESDQQSIISFSVDLSDGTYKISKNLPLIFDHVKGQIIYGANYPTPHVKINGVNN
ncbi:6-bladed beta-propeller [Fodinibius salsisoli]|uniref:6-bladed beta-propeller n=1 Tax=Fodinibius salsisoli TaxID=2820877 RepID=A0ABT3PSS9_9BACT|nr:6-bladed beta-propeller [Fodinibius salsisoli]MCW9708900.1 6-bladed beta-propeller [Fodinibius salsisoli]